MAFTKLAKRGYGQLELNFAAFRRSGDIEAKCKIADGIPFIENGMFLAVDRATYTVGYPTGAKGEIVALNYTTEHMYDERRKALKDFKLDAGTFLPRLGYIGRADKFTTNTVCYEASYNGDGEETTDFSAFKYGRPCVKKGFEGYIELVTDREPTLEEGETAAPVCVEVMEITTMPDGQKAVKFAGL